MSSIQELLESFYHRSSFLCNRSICSNTRGPHVSLEQRLPIDLFVLMPRGPHTNNFNSNLNKTTTNNLNDQQQARQQKLQVKLKQDQYNQKYATDLLRLQLAINTNHAKVKQNRTTIRNNEIKIKRKMKMELLRGKPFHSTPWRPPPSASTPREFSPRIPTNSIPIQFSATSFQPRSPTRPTRPRPKTANTQRRQQKQRKQWKPTRSVSSFDPTSKDDILYDPRTAKPMNAKQEHVYIQQLKNRIKKPRPHTATGRRRQITIRTRRTKTKTATTRTIASNDYNLPWWTMKTTHASPILYTARDIQHNTTTHSKPRQQHQQSQSIRQCFTSPRLTRPSDRVLETRLDESRAVSRLDGNVQNLKK